MYFSLISEEGIVTAVPKLKGKASAGFDEICDFLIKECIKCTKKPFNFFNESINQGVFLDLTKIAKMRPIYKNSSKQEISNYRSMSVSYKGSYKSHMA
jgi:hypothetical protein